MESNEKQKNDFARRAEKGGVPRAYIIDGAFGTGKTDLAFFCASVLLCEKGGYPCGKCNSCVKIKNRAHPDVRLFCGDSKPITMKEVRALIASANIKPNDGKYNIYIIASAERMREEAQNALLKILEEPPDSCVIFLLAAGRGVLLPTVLSRCTVIKTSPESRETLLEHLKKKYKKIPERELEEAAAASGGSPGNAEKLLEKGTREYYRNADELSRLLLKNDGYGIFRFFNGLKYEKEKTAEFLSVLTEVLNGIFVSLPAGAEKKRLYGYIRKTEEGLDSLSHNGNLNAVKAYLSTLYR